MSEKEQILEAMRKAGVPLNAGKVAGKGGPDGAEMADDCSTVDVTVTPYKVDKVFRLVCSGFRSHASGMVIEPPTLK